MMLILTPLILSGLAMTHADKFIDDLSVEPLREHLYLFDVTTDAQLAEVTGALNGVAVRHVLKVIGEDRYLVVAASNSSQALRDLAFPAGSDVTQSPIQYLEDYFKMFGVTSGFEHDYDTPELFAGAVVTVLEWNLIFSVEATTSEYKSLVRTMAKRFLQFHSVAKPVTYALTGSYPPRFYTLVGIQDNAVQHVGRDSLSFLGGPGRVYNRMLNAVEA